MSNFPSILIWTVTPVSIWSNKLNFDYTKTVPVNSRIQFGSSDDQKNHRQQKNEKRDKDK